MSLLYSMLLPVLLLVFLEVHHRKNKRAILKRIIKSKIKGERNTEMVELAKKFIDKKCLIYTFDNSLIGTIKNVTDGGILLLNAQGMEELLNMDFVVRIREYPKKKNGKDKSLCS